MYRVYRNEDGEVEFPFVIDEDINVEYDEEFFLTLTEFATEEDARSWWAEKQNDPLYVKGNALLDAAWDYWEEYQKQKGYPGAVVWLQGNDGALVVFTRGEYKDQLMYNIMPFADDHYF